MQQDYDLKRIDKLIADLGGFSVAGRSRGPFDLLLEHLQGARRSLLGSMKAEYGANLRQAKESLPYIPKSARSEIKKLLQSLIDGEPQQLPSLPDSAGHVPPAAALAAASR